MDELALLEADSMAAVAARQVAGAAARKAAYSIPAADFTASLDYIDSLASRRALALGRRDVAYITMGGSSAFDYAVWNSKPMPSPTDVGFRLSTDFRPLGDARRFDPEEIVRPPRALVKSASRVVSQEVFPAWHPVTPELPPNRWREDYERGQRESDRLFEKQRRPNLFANYGRRRFSVPNQVVLCLRRKIRRQIMHSMGFAGSHYKPRHFSPWSWVVC